jgi:hypothetical protein
MSKPPLRLKLASTTPSPLAAPNVDRIAQLEAERAEILARARARAAPRISLAAQAALKVNDPRLKLAPGSKVYVPPPKVDVFTPEMKAAAASAAAAGGRLLGMVTSFASQSANLQAAVSSGKAVVQRANVKLQQLGATAATATKEVLRAPSPGNEQAQEQEAERIAALLEDAGDKLVEVAETVASVTARGSMAIEGMLGTLNNEKEPDSPLIPEDVWATLASDASVTRQTEQGQQQVLPEQQEQQTNLIDEKLKEAASEARAQEEREKQVKLADEEVVNERVARQNAEKDKEIQLLFNQQLATVMSYRDFLKLTKKIPEHFVNLRNKLNVEALGTVLRKLDQEMQQLTRTFTKIEQFLQEEPTQLFFQMQQEIKKTQEQLEKIIEQSPETEEEQQELTARVNGLSQKIVLLTEKSEEHIKTLNKVGISKLKEALKAQENVPRILHLYGLIFKRIILCFIGHPDCDVSKQRIDEELRTFPELTSFVGIVAPEEQELYRQSALTTSVDAIEILKFDNQDCSKLIDFVLQKLGPYISEDYKISTARKVVEVFKGKRNDRTQEEIIRLAEQPCFENELQTNFSQFKTLADIPDEQLNQEDKKLALVAIIKGTITGIVEGLDVTYEKEVISENGIVKHPLTQRGVTKWSRPPCSIKMRDEEYNKLSEKDKKLVNESYQQYGLQPSGVKLGGRKTLRKKNRRQKTNKRVKKTKKV